jgi:DMSO reductase family type II enzyme heme b subunit
LRVLLIGAAALVAAPPCAADGGGSVQAWEALQRHCRPCHGSLAAGDGPYARAFRQAAPDLVAGAGSAVSAPVRLARILEGYGSAGEQAMPAFADVLSASAARDLLALLVTLRVERASAASGQAVFEQRCAVCHGSDGRGGGPLAAELIPRPRDLTRAWYRFRSTPSGVRPRGGDVAATLRRGLGVTAMGSFAALGDANVAAVTAHVAAVAQALPDASPSPAPASGRPEAALVARGRTLYDEARCWQCHGAAGRGDGPSARELRDDAGMASLPANLTQRWRLKGGADGEALTRAIANGLNGTPMPSYADVLNAEDLRAVAAYAWSLGRDRPPVPPRLSVRRVAGAVPDDPDAAFWDQRHATAVPLGPQAFRTPRWTRPAIDVVEVAAVWSPAGFAIHLTWDDRFEDREDLDADAAAGEAIDDAARTGHWRLPDQVAVQLALVPDGAPWPPLDGGSADRPVTRWRWSAAATAPWVEDAHGADDLRPRADAVLTGTARFGDGRWRLALVGGRGADPGVAMLAPGARLVFAVQAWDGSQGEQGSRHGLSSWIAVTLPDA